ncbi:MAG: hypothetical protein GY805_31780 [Chloroflexi bacterium]|nr:hypothetical protein [Chloroflexota bacterium]
MLILLIIKFVVVAVFLFMFWRRPSIHWGVGLLTVLSAVLLDTFLGTFNQDDVLNQFGFFYYIIVGFLVGGTAYWLFALLRPFQAVEQVTSEPTAVSPRSSTNPIQFSPGTDESNTTYDRQMMYEEIRDRLSREDVLDLLFDLNIQDNEVMTLQQELHPLIINLMQLTAKRNQTGQLALAVERILIPPAPETLPRLEKISVTSPPTILRHYLLAYYDMERLQKTAVSLNIDWEQLNLHSKKSTVRDLLHTLYRRDRIDELIAIMQAPNSAAKDVDHA